MKMSKITLASLLGLAAAACSAESLEGENVGEVTQAAQAKVDICHYDDEGVSHIITVAEAAYDAHVDHGDHAVGGEVCDGIDNDCDGVADPNCCVEVLLHCDSGSAVLETLCGGGNHVLQPNTAANISYVRFGSGVASVTLNHCQDSSSLSGASLALSQDTNLCDLEGGCCGSNRWNDSVCSIDIN